MILNIFSTIHFFFYKDKYLRAPKTLRLFPTVYCQTLFFYNTILFKAIPIWTIKWYDIIVELDLENHLGEINILLMGVFNPQPIQR